MPAPFWIAPPRSHGSSGTMDIPEIIFLFTLMATFSTGMLSLLIFIGHFGTGVPIWVLAPAIAVPPSICTLGMMVTGICRLCCYAVQTNNTPTPTISPESTPTLQSQQQKDRTRMIDNAKNIAPSAPKEIAINIPDDKLSVRVYIEMKQNNQMYPPVIDEKTALIEDNPLKREYK